MKMNTFNPSVCLFFVRFLKKALERSQVNLLEFGMFWVFFIPFMKEGANIWTKVVEGFTEDRKIKEAHAQ